MRDVRFISIMTSSEVSDLGDIIELLQSLFCRETQRQLITDPASFTGCVEMLVFHSGTALLSGYGAWADVDFHDKEKISKKISDGHKAFRFAAVIEEPNVSFETPGFLCLQNANLNQSPRHDATKVLLVLH